MPTVAPIGISGGVNTSADAATKATTTATNLTIGPAGENTQRPGLVDASTTGMGAAPINGAYKWRTWVIFVDSDRKLWAMPEGAPYTVVALSDATAATQLAGTARPVFAEDGLPRLVIAGGNTILQWTGVGLCSALITSGATPAATHVAYLGQRLIANDVSNPTIWLWSDIGDGSHQSWTASQFTTPDASPDGVVGVYANVREAYVFGEKTLQVYGVGQDPLNPFDSISVVQVGCSAPYSPVDVDGAWMWLDDRRRIVISNGRSFEDLSGDISTTLRGMTTVSDCWSFRADHEHDTNYVFVFPTEGQAWVFNPGNKSWTDWSHYTGQGPDAFPVASHAFWPAQNVNVFGALHDSTVYRFDPDVHTDIGDPLVMDRVTGWLDHGTNTRKRSIRVRCVLRRGTGGASGTTDSFEVRKADDGGPWDAWEFVDIGLAGDNDQTVDAYLGGVFRRRRYQFRYSGTQETSLLSAEEHFEPVSS